MKRSIVTLGLVGLLATSAVSACNQAETPDDDGGGSNTSGSPSTAGSGGGVVSPVAGTGPSAAGSSNPTGGSGGSAPGTAGASTGGSAGASAGGTSDSGGAPSTAGTGGSAGGTGNPACPVKIDSQVMCTQVISCPGAYCGVFQMGKKDCDCAAASGAFTCTSCDYTGRTEEIVLPPAAVLPACSADDTTLEKNTPTCTKGDRCKSLTVDKNRFCACWENPTDGALKWDCDSQPASWPK
jgi:hypothetical protein